MPWADRVSERNGSPGFAVAQLLGRSENGSPITTPIPGIPGEAVARLDAAFGVLEQQMLVSDSAGAERAQ
jgi:hypothetical protein